MTGRTSRWALAAAAVGLAACGSSSSSNPAPAPGPTTCTPPATPTVTFRDDVYPILLTECGACHGDNQSSRPKLASADPQVAYSAVRAEVDPSNATSSRLIVSGNGGNGHPVDALTDAQTATITRWIQECAQDNARSTTTTTTMP
jgi:hypothetical protein